MPHLFPFQVIGADWLSNKRLAFLADEMRLGKSPQSIVAADEILAERILVICPAVARLEWARAFEKFSAFKRKMDVILHGGRPPEAGRSVICSYDLASKVKDWGGRFDLVILDEWHFLKSMDAKRTKALVGAKGVVHNAARTWALTGTPMPNHPGELWVLLYTFGATKLRYDAFCARYCEFAPGYKGHQRIVGAKQQNISELKELLRPIMLRRTKEEVMPELPPLLFTDVVVEPGPVVLKDSRVLREAFASNMELFGRVAEEKNRLAKFLKDGITADFMKVLEGLAQSISTLTLYNGLQKVAAISELVSGELGAKLYEKIVIFATHRDVVDQLTTRLAAYNPVKIYGGQGESQRRANIDAFQNDPACQIAICNIRAAGTAIDLSASSEVLFIEREFSPNDNLQAAKRCDRYDQTRGVNVRFAHIANSIDEKVGKILRRKTRDISFIFDDAPSRGKALDEFKPLDDR